MNPTLLGKAHYMLSNGGLWDCKAFWVEAISTACYLVNRFPHTSIDFQISKEI